MAVFSVIFSLFISLCLVLYCSPSRMPDDAQLFAAFVEKYDRTYVGVERERRFRIFKDTLVRIGKRNDDHAAGSNRPFGVTQYADLTPDEFRHAVLSRRKTHVDAVDDARLDPTNRTREPTRTKRAVIVGPQVTAVPVHSDLPKRVDWRDSKVVNPVRNQGECGACWALSTVETLESMYAIRTGQLPLISVQQVIDCAEDGNLGCQGGDTCLALLWMNSTQVRLVPDAQYPFQHATGVCRSQNSTKGFQLKDFTCEDYTNREEIMLELLANHGPLVVAVDAVMWQDYLGGIIRFHCEAAHNHAVQIVGYDATGPVPYYIIRNSWGTDFGIDGYLYVAIGSNLCGLANEVSALDAVI